MAAAAAVGDISTVLSLMAQAASQTPADFVKKTVGSILFMYYTYMDTFHSRPRDMFDLVDGLLFIDAKNYIREQYIIKAKREGNQ